MNLIRLYYTLKDLRWAQFWFRVWHPVKRRLVKPGAVPDQYIDHALSWPTFPLFALPTSDQYNPIDKSFKILNIPQAFQDGIDWNYDANGALWRYHLNYFGWLGDETLDVDARLNTLMDYANASPSLKAGLDSYPISLRGMNSIRFFLRHGIKDTLLVKTLYLDINRLCLFPEYSIQGNHLWQNGCTLIVGGYFFKNQRFYNKGKKILKQALADQLLDDGAHIEGSPMYHSLLLESLMKCIELGECLSANSDPDFMALMKQKAGHMMGWLEQITFSNGEWPRVNDATGGVAPSLATLQAFANSLNILSNQSPLNASGYRLFRQDEYELFIDAGAIQPAWQPGHAHSDELSFCLNVCGKPVIVDAGASTYEVGDRRTWQRSTNAHNTLSLNGKNTSDVWKSFRVGKKAAVNILEEKENSIKIECSSSGMKYTREFELTRHGIDIHDVIHTGIPENVYLHIHLDDDIVLKKYNDFEFLAGNLQICILGALAADVETYYLSEEFNKKVPAQRLRIKTGTTTLTRLQLLHAD